MPAQFSQPPVLSRIPHHAGHHHRQVRSQILNYALCLSQFLLVAQVGLMQSDHRSRPAVGSQHQKPLDLGRAEFAIHPVHHHNSIHIRHYRLLHHIHRRVSSHYRRAPFQNQINDPAHLFVFARQHPIASGRGHDFLRPQRIRCRRDLLASGKHSARPPVHSTDPTRPALKKLRSGTTGRSRLLSPAFVPAVLL